MIGGIKLSSKINTKTYTIFDAFNQCFYIVPDYQREYVWTEKEVNQLLDDINDEIDETSKEYFIGTVLVSPTEINNQFDVIDGQQRLTTLFLILVALKQLFENEQQGITISGLISTDYTTMEGDSVTTLKLEPRYENGKELIEKIVEVSSNPLITRNAVNSSGISTYGSLENILNAYDTIYEYLKTNYYEKDGLKKYWGYLANKVVFIQISTDISNALKIFETINERGIGLNPMDLLKNLLFTQVKEDEFKKLKDEWKNIISPLEQHNKKPLRFIRYYLMANYKIKNDRNDSIVREDEIYDWFNNDRNTELCNYKKEPFKFVKKLKQNVDRYIKFSLGYGNDGLNNIHMENLKMMCGGAFSLHYILLLAASNLPKNIFDHFVMQLESFLFYYIFTKTTTRELERNFSMWADELREIANINDIQDQITQYNNFLINRFSENVKAKELELEDVFKRYTFHSMQQYRTRYLLAKLTQYVDMEYKGIKKPGRISEYTTLEIEHILPNTPGPELLNHFTLKNPDIDYNEYKVRLGNLTLLEKPINIVASNDFFTRKCAEYKKSKYYLTSSIAELTTVGKNSSINRVNLLLESCSKWDANSINERQNILANLAKKVWKIEVYEA